MLRLFFISPNPTNYGGLKLPVVRMASSFLVPDVVGTGTGTGTLDHYYPPISTRYSKWFVLYTRHSAVALGTRHLLEDCLWMMV